jgi:sialate O-acetylesterase
MTITGGDRSSIVLEDILVGEVWLGSGQSNMVARVKNFVDRDSVLATLAGAAPYPRIRLKSSGPGGWQLADAGAVSWSSAIMFTLAVRLQQALDVPVGILVGAVPGTASGLWLSSDAFHRDAACQALIVQAQRTYDPQLTSKAYDESLAAWQQAAARARPGARTPPRPEPPLAPGACRGELGSLYEAHIRPFQPYAIRGVVWDQGESGTAIGDVDQATLMGALIAGWRADWHQEALPFIDVEKPSGGGCAFDPADPVTKQADAFTGLPALVPGDGALRGNHLRIMDYPQTALAISSDLGGKTHPDNKSGYGSRVARVALGMVYGQVLEYYGPRFATVHTVASEMQVSFTHIGSGLTMAHGDRLQGFAISGEDHHFVWAEAHIVGDGVVISNSQVPHPVAIRYAWAASIPWANLFNKDGLPAIPFRSDTWSDADPPTGARSRSP